MRYLVATKPFIRGSCRYYTLTNKYGAARLLLFDKKDTAEKFKNFVTEYKYETRRWPLIDGKTQEIGRSSKGNEHEREKIERHVNIIGWKTDDVYKECINKKIAFVTATNFEYDLRKDYINMKAIETEMVK